MKYLVMECHMAYAVVLDEDGRFLKAANMGYEVGQTLDTIMEIVEPGPAFSNEQHPSDIFYDTAFEEGHPSASKKSRPLLRLLRRSLPVAAAFCLFLSAGHYFIMSPYGTVRISINPKIELSVNRLNYVLTLSGINPDGEHLIQGYEYKRKTVSEAALDLTERARTMGYLTAGGTVYIGASSVHEDWEDDVKKDLAWELGSRLEPDIHISAGPKPDEPPENKNPLSDPANSPEKQRPDSDHNRDHKPEKDSDDDRDEEPDDDFADNRDEEPDDDFVDDRDEN